MLAVRGCDCDPGYLNVKYERRVSRTKRRCFDLEQTKIHTNLQSIPYARKLATVQARCLQVMLSPYYTTNRRHVAYTSCFLYYTTNRTPAICSGAAGLGGRCAAGRAFVVWAGEALVVQPGTP